MQTKQFSPNKIIDILSLSTNATAIYSGEEMIIQAANDAIIAIWGKDRSVIGKPLAEAVPELEGQAFMDILLEVWRTGVTYTAQDYYGEFVVDGQKKSFYFDFTYLAVKDDEDRMICILNTATDVTDRFLKNQAIAHAQRQTEALEREQALNEELAAANEELTAINEELHQSREQLRDFNDELEERVLNRTNSLAESEA